MRSPEPVRLRYLVAGLGGREYQAEEVRKSGRRYRRRYQGRVPVKGEKGVES